jgi:hypothetical protein
MNTRGFNPHSLPHQRQASGATGLRNSYYRVQVAEWCGWI